MAQFKPKSSSLKPAKFGGGGSNQLLAYMLAQQKGESMDSKLGGGAVPVGGTDPSSGARYETQAGHDMDISTTLRKKAGEDALKLQEALPMLQDLEDSYKAAYQNVQGEKSGFGGAMTASKEYGVGVLLRQNQPLRQFMDKLSQYESPLVKISGDSGNFSGSERQSARQGLPKVGPNTDFHRLFMPDDPEFGLSKIASLKSLYASKFKEALDVSNTGKLSPGYAEWAKSNQAYTGGSDISASLPSANTSSPIPGMDSGDKRSQYNELRGQGLSAEEARKRLGI